MAGSTSRTRRVASSLLVCVAALAADLTSKAWAWETLRRGGRRVVVEGLLRFEFAFNTGSAFGFLRRLDAARTVFIAITVLVLIYLGRMLRRLPLTSAVPFVAVGLFAGGAIGNLHDRLVRHMWIFDQGDRYGVVDFIVVSVGRRTWPAFNLADVALAVGVGLLIVSLVRRARAPQG
ncbi:MAG: signal peptidase II [Myxococcota bacterium]